MRAPLRVLAWTMFAVGLVGDVVQLLDALPGRTAVVSASYVSQFSGLLVLGSVGLLLAVRRPDNPLGWIFLAGYALDGIVGALTVYAGSAATTSGSLRTLALWLVNWAWVPLVGGLVLYPLLLFPTGRFQSPAWRRLGRLGGVVIATMSVGFAFGSADYTDPAGIPVPNPYAPANGAAVFDVLRYAGAFALILLVIVALVGLFRRFRRGGEVVRAQLKWFFAAGAIWVIFLGYPGDHGDGGPIDVFTGVALAAFPAAVGIAVLRYRLYDIDRIISRTASYAIVTALVLATYGVVVTVVLHVLPDSSSLAVAAATLAAAAVARPAVRRVQRVVDRRFDRARFDATRTLDGFAWRLQQVVDADAVSGDLTAVVRASLSPAKVFLWLPTR